MTTEVAYEEAQNNFLRPIANASLPAFLAGVTLAALQLGTGNFVVKYSLIFSTISYFVSSLAIFFFSIYPKKRSLSLVGGVAFVAALVSSLFGVILLGLLSVI